MTARHTSQRISQRDRQVLDYLRFIADNEGTVGGSTYAIARELGMHRQTLSRVLQRLAKTGAVVLEDHACTPVRVTNHVTDNVTDNVTNNVTNNVTDTVTDIVTDIGPQNVLWTITCTLPHIPRYVTGNTENVTLSPENVTFSPKIVTLSPEIETQTVTDKKETKQKNEEIPPAPPKEEKKQKKEKNPLTPACVREEISTKSDESRLEQRRQRFFDALQPFTTRYGQEMITQVAEILDRAQPVEHADALRTATHLEHLSAPFQMGKKRLRLHHATPQRLQPKQSQRPSPTHFRGLHPGRASESHRRHRTIYPRSGTPQGRRPPASSLLISFHAITCKFAKKLTVVFDFFNTFVRNYNKLIGLK